MLAVMFNEKAVDSRLKVNTLDVLNLSFTSNFTLTQQNIIFQHYYLSYCDYLLKMGRMDKERAVFEQLALSEFKKLSSTALKIFNNYTVILTSNSDKIRIF